MILDSQKIKMAWKLIKSFFVKDDSEDSMTMSNFAVFDWTPLHSAMIATDKTSRKQRLETIMKLLRNPETNVNRKNAHGETPLHMACKTNFKEAVTKLISIPDIDVNAHDNSWKTPVMAAAENGKKEALWLMLRDPRVNLTLRSKEGKGLLDLLKDFDGDYGEVLACFEMIKKEIIKRSARTNMHCEECARQGRKLAKIPSFNEAMSKLNGGRGIGVNTRDINGWTSLHFAALAPAYDKQRLKVITNLLENRDIDVNVKTSLGETALHVACRNNFSEAVSKLLTTQDIDVNVIDNKGRTPIMVAAEHGNENALGLMLMDPQVNLDCRSIEYMGLEEILEDFSIGFDSMERTQCFEMIRKARIKRRQWNRNQNGFCHGDNNGFTERNDSGIIDGWTIGYVEMKENMRKTVEEERKKRIKEKLDMKMKIDTSSMSHHILEAARRTLECPICLELMKPPTRIWMCQTSHLICEGCKDQLDGLWCPMCRVDRVTLRALFAEHIAETLF